MNRRYIGKFKIKATTVWPLNVKRWVGLMRLALASGQNGVDRSIVHMAGT